MARVIVSQRGRGIKGKGRGKGNRAKRKYVCVFIWGRGQWKFEGEGRGQRQALAEKYQGLSTSQKLELSLLTTSIYYNKISIVVNLKIKIMFNQIVVMLTLSLQYGEIIVKLKPKGKAMLEGRVRKRDKIKKGGGSNLPSLG